MRLSSTPTMPLPRSFLTLIDVQNTRPMPQSPGLWPSYVNSLYRICHLVTSRTTGTTDRGLRVLSQAPVRQREAPRTTFE